MEKNQAKVILEGKQILFLGAGAIAESMLRGLIGGHVISGGQVMVLNRSNVDRLSELADRYGVKTFSMAQDPDHESLRKALGQADLIVLATKPYDIARILETIKPYSTDTQATFLSVAAGISTDLIESLIGNEAPVVRSMPNTSCTVLESATAYCTGQFCSELAAQTAVAVLSALGTVTQVEEGLMDAVTGVSGSGPAYFYYMVEAMQQAAESQGLSNETARTLILQTLFGAGKMMLETGLSARELRKQVTSPGGTTMAGIREFDNARCKETIEQVIEAATHRSREMGEEQRAMAIQTES